MCGATRRAYTACVRGVCMARVHGVRARRGRGVRIAWAGRVPGHEGACRGDSRKGSMVARAVAVAVVGGGDEDAAAQEGARAQLRVRGRLLVRVRVRVRLGVKVRVRLRVRARVRVRDRVRVRVRVRVSCQPGSTTTKERAEAAAAPCAARSASTCAAHASIRQSTKGGLAAKEPPDGLRSKKEPAAVRGGRCNPSWRALQP